jgi:hypothetical protein
MRTKPSSNTTTVDRELSRARRLMRHKCKLGGECCPDCFALYQRVGYVSASHDNPVVAEAVDA